MGRRLSLVLAVALLALPLAVGLVSAQEIPENLTKVRPEAPPVVENVFIKVINLILYAVIGFGIIRFLGGVAKFAMGAPDAGKWLVQGIVALAVGLGGVGVILWFVG